MHIFDYEQQVRRVMTSEIVSVIAKICEYKGCQDIVINTHKNEVRSLLEVARIQSTGASNETAVSFSGPILTN